MNPRMGPEEVGAQAGNLTLESQGTKGLSTMANLRRLLLP